MNGAKCAAVDSRACPRWRAIKGSNSLKRCRSPLTMRTKTEYRRNMSRRDFPKILRLFLRPFGSWGCPYRSSSEKNILRHALKTLAFSASPVVKGVRRTTKRRTGAKCAVVRESLNSTYRKLNHQRSVFPSDRALLKALYLATFEATKKWTMQIRNRGKIYGELSIMYEGRLPE